MFSSAVRLLARDPHSLQIESAIERQQSIVRAEPQIGPDLKTEIDRIREIFLSKYHQNGAARFSCQFIDCCNGEEETTAIQPGI